MHRDPRSASKRRKVEPSTSGSETSDNSGTKYQNEDSYDKVKHINNMPLF